MSFLPMTNRQHDEVVAACDEIIGLIMDNYPVADDGSDQAADPILRRVQDLTSFIYDVCGSIERQDLAVIGGWEHVEYPGAEEAVGDGDS